MEALDSSYRKLRWLHRWRTVRALLLCGLATMTGCGRGDDAESRIAAMNDSNIRRVANLYHAFQLRKGMKGPKDEAEFKRFIEHEMPAIKLQRMQVDRANVTGLLTSERDEKPFVIRYGVDGGLGSEDAVVFEQEGVGGMRQVAFTNGAVEEMDAARYETHLQGKAQRVQNASAQSASGV